MPAIQTKVKYALDEGRILILGATVLLGFGYRSTLQAGFDALPASSQVAKMVSLGLMLLTVALLMTPASHHRLVEGGEDTRRLHAFATLVLAIALLPFALALGLDLYVALERVGGLRWGVITGALTSLTALALWYGAELVSRARRPAPARADRARGRDGDEGGTPLEDKISHVLTEVRVVLPGVQTLLGFQLASVLVEGFDQLPKSSQYVHAASLAAIALSVILLMMPAAYHRIVEEGEETERFHAFAGRVLLLAMIPLALGLAGDLFVVVRKVTESVRVSVVGAALAVAVLYGLWFGLMLYLRRARAA